MEQYDLILLLIPVALLLGTVTFSVLGVSFGSAVAGGSAVSSILVAHALFISPPVNNDQSAAVN